MTGIIFTETLRRGWRVMLYWGIGMAIYSVINTVIILDNESLAQMMSIMESLPPFLIQGFVGSADIEFMTSPNGYFATQFFSLALLVFSAYAVMAGMAVTANDEDAGILDSFLSLPVPRWAVIVERALAYALLMAGTLVISFAGAAVGTAMVPQVSYDLGGIAAGMANLFPSMGFVMTGTVLLGVLFRRRSMTLGVASALVVVSYMVDFIASGAPDSAFANAGYLSYFNYYDGVAAVQFGLNAGNVALLLVAALVCGTLALWRFQRRDIGL